MPRYLNTDNGQILTVAEHEALIYEDASNFTRVDESQVEPAKAEVPKRAKASVPKRTKVDAPKPEPEAVTEEEASEAGRVLEVRKEQIAKPKPAKAPVKKTVKKKV